MATENMVPQWIRAELFSGTQSQDFFKGKGPCKELHALLFLKLKKHNTDQFFSLFFLDFSSFTLCLDVGDI